MTAPANPTVNPAARAMLRDVLAGLSATPRAIPSKYLYDAEGSRLFDRITALDAYYPTRTELGILREHIDEIAECIGPGAVLIEYGSGSSTKTRLLLDALAPTLAAYVPIDISREHLLRTAERLRADYPGLRIEPVVADYTRPHTIPDDPVQRRKRVVFFPGSTVGNFEPEEAQRFLGQIVEVIGPGGGLLLGVDRKKDPAVLERAYDDDEGVTAAFNLNLLARLNRDLGADFDLDAWAHRAFYDAERGRIEMHLVSLRDQTVHVGGRAFAFREGETIHTENSYKYGPGEIEAIAAPAGLHVVREWSDPAGWFSLLYFEV
ncbi:MAG TPA: L-histidine N(alpha)-methyltransferase [Rubricoccaceae bacterium]|jgi:dimethylhistidine N-methyltransferase|nr:L-histidine N(alpha)-methyltransferase [Rubricoccaceae bacterium]